jgi:hypothetical protein
VPLYDHIRTLARRRVEAIGLTSTAEAAQLDKAQLSRWLADGKAHRELRADAFSRLADSLERQPAATAVAAADSAPPRPRRPPRPER